MFESLAYQFKISVTIGETEQPLLLYQKIYTRFEKFELEDIIILEKLSKNKFQISNWKAY